GRASLTTAYKVRVMREGQPLVTLSKDGSFKAAVVAGMGVLLSARQGELNGWGFTLNGKPVAPPPGAEGLRAGGAWDVYVELEGKRTQLGSTKVCWDEPNHQYQFWRGSVTLPPGVTRVRVVLAPNPRLAAVRTAIDVMPDGEIVIDDVEVRR
ncbi:MAG: hypothetical protein K2Q09_08395, partial [Phycisphaerales bacterium]|nr:hypothetical protein [Phycisphaerales bacterium]